MDEAERIAIVARLAASPANKRITFHEAQALLNVRSRERIGQFVRVGALHAFPANGKFGAKRFLLNLGDVRRIAARHEQGLAASIVIGRGLVAALSADLNIEKRTLGDIIRASGRSVANSDIDEVISAVRFAGKRLGAIRSGKLSGRLLIRRLTLELSVHAFSVNNVLDFARIDRDEANLPATREAFRLLLEKLETVSQNYCS